jgi:hypothetical protein
MILQIHDRVQHTGQVVDLKVGGINYNNDSSVNAKTKMTPSTLFYTRLPGEG